MRGGALLERIKHRGLRKIAIPVLGVFALAGAGAGAYFYLNEPKAYPQGQCPPNAIKSVWEWPKPIAPRIRDRFGDPAPDHCVTVTGTVMYVHKEIDGDWHLRVLVDPQYRNLLVTGTPQDPKGNDFQRVGGYNDLLVVEIEPQHCPKGINIEANHNCADLGGYIQPDIPDVGRRVKITGLAVVDYDPAHIAIYKNDGAIEWGEIHPATAITDLGPSDIQIPSAGGLEDGD